MKQIINVIFLSLSLFLFVSCEDQGELKPKHVMIVGDSWGQLMCLFGSFNDVMKDQKADFKKTKEVECLLTTKNGSETKEWIGGSKLDRVRAALVLNRSVTHVVISLGGNDFLSEWDKSKSDIEVQRIIDGIVTRMNKLVDEIKLIRSDVKIIISGYDYPNFTYVSKLTSAYMDLFEKLGRPTPEEINDVFLALGQRMAEYARSKSDVTYANAHGISQHHFGQKDFSIDPKTLPLPGQGPDFYPFDGGDRTLPAPKEAMIGVDLGIAELVDAYHLNKKGYYFLVESMYKHHIR